MPILPLPQFEADIAELEAEREALAKLKPPTTVVVRFGSMRLIGEYKYEGDQVLGCGSKLVVRTHRGTELGEMLTSTCPNSGCSKSISRGDMMEYIQRSGGRDYPFFTNGRVLRIATIEDLDAQAKIEQSKHGLRADARDLAERLGAGVKVVEVEPILGGERLTCYYLSEERVDTRDLGEALARRHGVQVDVRHVGARDEARLTADYERCGQHCCCQSFLKVLKPVSMRSAKVQKATLEPLKISGRCGRLMCCLRYEDQTYADLKKRLPHRKTRVGTPEGDGIVLQTQILTQLVLVLLDDGREVAVPVEELGLPGSKTAPVAPEEAGRRERDERRARRADERARRDEPARDRPPPAVKGPTSGPAAPHPTGETPGQDKPGVAGGPATTTETPGKKKRRRRRRKGERPEVGSGEGVPASDRPVGDHPTTGAVPEDSASPPEPDDDLSVTGRSLAPDSDSSAPGGARESRAERARRRRRRRRKRHGGEGPPSGGGGAPDSNSPSS